MMKSIRVRWAIRGMMGAGLLWGMGPVAARSAEPTPSETPKTVTETIYFKDVSAYFYQSLPFLKKGYRFIDSSNSLEPKEGTPCSLLVAAPNTKEDDLLADAKPIHVTKDFAPFIHAIKTSTEALTYVMFLNRKGYPWMEPIKFDYFQDVTFTGIEFLRVSSSTVARHGIRPPSVSVEKGKKRFTIVRTVVPLDQPNLKEDKILSGQNPIQLTELAEVTEIVVQDGTYSFTLRRFPVKNFPIQNPLRALRKP